MDTQDIRTWSSREDRSAHEEVAPRIYGVNWPFPPVDGPIPWTNSQQKKYKDKLLNEAEEALL